MLPLSRAKSAVSVPSEQKLRFCLMSYFIANSDALHQTPMGAISQASSALASCTAHKILCSSCTRSPITMGLDKKPSMPLSNALRRSSSNALAVMARIGSFARAGSSSARIVRVGRIEEVMVIGDMLDNAISVADQCRVVVIRIPVEVMPESSRP